MSVHRKKDGRYYVHYRDDQNNRHIKLFGRGPLQKKEAEAFDLELKAKKKRGEKLPSPSRMYFGQWLNSMSTTAAQTGFRNRISGT